MSANSGNLTQKTVEDDSEVTLVEMTSAGEPNISTGKQREKTSVSNVCRINYVIQFRKDLRYKFMNKLRFFLQL